MDPIRESALKYPALFTIYLGNISSFGNRYIKWFVAKFYGIYSYKEPLVSLKGTNLNTQIILDFLQLYIYIELSKPHGRLNGNHPTSYALSIYC